MKILYIAGAGTLAYRARHNDTGFGLGGLRKAQLSVEALTRAGHEVLVLSSAVTSHSRFRWRKEEREQWALSSGRAVEVRYPATLPIRPIGGLLNSIRAPWLAEELRKDFKPEVVISYNSYLFESLAALTLKRRAGIPILLQVEDLPLARRREYRNLKPWLDQQCWPHMLRAATGFTAVNESLLSVLPADKPKRLLPGIIDDGLLRAADRRTPPFSAPMRSVGYFGGLSEAKGVRVLLESPDALPQDWSLKVGGSGPLTSEFVALAESRPGRVEFLGNLAGDDLYDAICSCDVTLVPREQITGDRSGVFPFKVLEYLVAGTHIISTALPPVGEIDLDFAERWDGSLDDLVTHLDHAPLAYEREAAQRSAAVLAARSKFTIAGASKLFSHLLDVVRKT